MGNSSGGKPLLIACGGCAILFIGFLLVSVGGALTLTQGATNAVRAHVILVKDGKLDEAYAALGKGFKESVTLEQFKGFVAHQTVLYQGDDLTLNNRQVKNDEATVSGTTTKGDRTVEVRFGLRREETAWRIVRIEFGTSTQPALDATLHHVRLVKEGKLAEAWSESSQAFQASTSQPAFEDFVKRTGSLYRGTALKLPASRFVDEAETEVEVQGTTTGPDKNLYDVRFKLVLEEEVWKLRFVQVKRAGEAEAEPEPAKTAPAKTDAPAKTEPAKTGG